MFRLAAEEIVFFMLRHKWLNQGKREIYEYAMETLLLNGGLLFVNFLFSIVFQQIPFFLAFLFIFVPIRKYLGGLHLDNSEFCMICSVTFYVITMFMNYIVYQKYNTIEMLVMIILNAICLFLKPLPEKIPMLQKYNKNKYIANGIMIIDLVVIIVCHEMGFAITSVLVLLDVCAVSFYLMAKVKMWLEMGDE